MSALSDYLERTLLNAVFKNVPFTQPEALYIALFKNNPTDAGTGIEETGGGYSRQAIEFTDPVDGLVENNATVNFPVATSDWGIVTHYGIYDAVTGGNLLIHGAFSIAKNVYSGDQYIIRAGDLDVQFS
jgi:hypothetical protein